MRYRMGLPTMAGRMAKYVEILFRHRLRFLILLIVLPAELAAACIFVFPHQTAASSLWVDTPAYISISPAVQGWNEFITPAQNTVDALNQLRSTDSYLLTLGSELDSMNTFRDFGERESVLSTVKADVLVTAAGSHLVQLTYTCPREPICSNVLTATEKIYRQWLTDQQNAQAKVAIDFYSGQIAAAQAKLNTDQSALTAYINAHPGVKASDAPLIPQFDLLTRNVNDDLIQLAGLQQKLDDTKLTDAAVGQTNNTVLKVIDPPKTTGGRLSALPKKQMIIAGVAGLALALAVLVLMAWSDRTVREPKELESMLRLPVVVTIPDLALMGSADG